ncbi:hypothetical protein HPT25_03685 [Bacillus sp. BRMEA1]|uniref:hypothetical protein n=1 Tax=Neobacillus endophyticus TaxID=2738405 RepID=UPI0015630E05|nr:hypothetical protein [Neobacillus endophyticus]NRD76592.1 hypothetical protein [Neobacillus endophyticus]
MINKVSILIGIFFFIGGLLLIRLAISETALEVKENGKLKGIALILIDAIVGVFNVTTKKASNFLVLGILSLLIGFIITIN